PELLREIANESMDDVPADIREGVRETYRLAADALEQRGFYATPRLFLITEAKAVEVELRGISDADKEQGPGWRTSFEGKVHANADGTDLVPVLAMESTENTYRTHQAAVIDAAHARPKRPLNAEEMAKAKAQVGVRLTKRQEKELAVTGGVTLTQEQKRQM